MLKMIAAATPLLTLASSLAAQTAPAPPVPDFSTATPIAGAWTYRSIPGGSEATFLAAGNQPQITLQCVRVTRTISIAKAAAAPAPYLSIWTSSASRSLPATYSPATARITVSLSAFDRVLDGLSFSRGRIAFAAAGAPALVTPAWGQIARVVEDCRS
jgi:hypothetical protein